VSPNEEAREQAAREVAAELAGIEALIRSSLYTVLHVEEQIRQVKDQLTDAYRRTRGIRR
jgi:hypothetical protein